MGKSHHLSVERYLPAGDQDERFTLCSHLIDHLMMFQPFVFVSLEKKCHGLPTRYVSLDFPQLEVMKKVDLDLSYFTHLDASGIVQITSPTRLHEENDVLKNMLPDLFGS